MEKDTKDGKRQLLLWLVKNAVPMFAKKVRILLQQLRGVLSIGAVYKSLKQPRFLLEITTRVRKLVAAILSVFAVISKLKVAINWLVLKLFFVKQNHVEASTEQEQSSPAKKLASKPRTFAFEFLTFRFEVSRSVKNAAEATTPVAPGTPSDVNEGPYNTPIRSDEKKQPNNSPGEGYVALARYQKLVEAKTTPRSVSPASTSSSTESAGSGSGGGNNKGKIPAGRPQNKKNNKRMQKPSAVIVDV